MNHLLMNHLLCEVEGLEHDLEHSIRDLERFMCEKEDDFAATVRERIEAGRRRRDTYHLRTVYHRFLGTSSDAAEEKEQNKADETRKMAKTSLAQALSELQAAPANGETIEEICLAFDADRDGRIDFDEFAAAALRLSPIEAWCKQIPWWHAIADAIPPLAHSDQPLRAVALLTDAQIDVICAEAQKSIRSELRTRALELSSAMKKRERMTNAAPAGAKFATFKASAGSPEDFHNGLSDRVGAPIGKFMQAMRLEHCVSYGHDISFTTPNYHITATPEKEWGIVVLGEPPAQQDMGHGRTILDLALDKHWAAPDGQVLSENHDPTGAAEERICEARKLVTDARLQRAEVAAVILYTGPMFDLINCLLRRFPTDRFDKYRDGSNLLPTTIAVLASAVQKIARIARIPEGTTFYRGLSRRMQLPDAFSRFDEQGRRGFAEWGFLSTTCDKDVALTYSYSGEGQADATAPIPMVLKISSSAVDRGASIRVFSQYPTARPPPHLPVSFYFLRPARFF